MSNVTVVVFRTVACVVLQVSIVKTGGECMRLLVPISVLGAVLICGSMCSVCREPVTQVLPSDQIISIS